MKKRTINIFIAGGILSLLLLATPIFSMLNSLEVTNVPRILPIGCKTTVKFEFVIHDSNLNLFKNIKRKSKTKKVEG